MKHVKIRTYVAIACVCLPLGMAHADIVFDNSRNDLLTRFAPGALEVGDEILLSGGARYLTNFSFEFWGTSTSGAGNFQGDVQARVRFYQNDGASYNGYASPGTLLYDSQWFSLGPPTPRNTMVFQAGSEFPSGGLFLPVLSNMTWSVQFAGLGANDQAGVDLYSPAVLGQDYPDYWQLGMDGWQLMQNTTGMDFAARFEASVTQVPEPGTLAFGLWTGAAVLAVYQGRKSRSAGAR